MMAGGTLVVFTSLNSFVKYLFSLLTVYIGIRFFRRFETIGLRITFVLLSIFMYFLGVIIYTMILVYNNPELLSGQ